MPPHTEALRLSPHAAALQRTAQRYRWSGGASFHYDRFTRHYVAAKLRMDPVHADVLAIAASRPFGAVIDLGCGFGQLGVALLEAGLADSVLGLDRRRRAVAQAARAACGLPFRAEARDLATGGGLDQADTILLIDVLYQMDDATQAALLGQVAGLARRRVLIRTAAMHRLAWAGEMLMRRVWPTAGAHVNAPAIAGLTAVLERHGFDVTIAPCSRGTPYPNLLIVAERAG